MLKNWKFWLSLLISGAALVLAFRGVPFDLFVNTLAHANTVWMLPAFVAFMVTLSLRAWRWSVLMGGTPFAITFHANNIGYMLNSMLPFRVGEVGRAFVIGERTSVSMTRSFSSIIVERALDLASLVVFFFVLTQFIPLPPLFTSAALAGGVVAIVVITLLTLMTFQVDRAEAVLAKVFARAPRINAATWLRRFRDLSNGFAAVKQPRKLALSLILTVVIWISTVFVSWFILLAFVPAGTFLEASTVVVASNLGGALPSAPGGLGVVQLFAQQALVIPFGVNETTAIAYAFVNSLSQQILLIVLGVIGLARIGMSFADTAKAGSAASAASPSAEPAGEAVAPVNNS